MGYPIPPSHEFVEKHKHLIEESKLRKLAIDIYMERLKHFQPTTVKGAYQTAKELIEFDLNNLT